MIRLGYPGSSTRRHLKPIHTHIHVLSLLLPFSEDLPVNSAYPFQAECSTSNLGQITGSDPALLIERIFPTFSLTLEPPKSLKGLFLKSGRLLGEFGKNLALRR